MADKKTKGVELAAGYVSLTVDTSKMGKEIEEEMGASGTRGAKKAAENHNKELNKRLKETSAGIGLAAVGGIAVGIDQAMKQADLPGTIQAQLGTTPQYAKEIASASAKAFGDGFGGSLDEVANTASHVGQALNQLGDSGDIEKLTVKTTAFATTFGQDTDGIVQAAQQMVKTGLAGSMDQAYDIMTKGFQGNKKMAEDGLDTINEYSVQFQQLGLTGADAMGLLNQGLNAGARNSDLVADGLKEFNIRAKDGSQTTADGFKAIGLDATKMAAAIAKGGPESKAALQLTLDKIREMKDPVKQAAASVSLFGTQSEDMQKALLALDPSKASQGLGKLAGAADDMTKNSMGMDQQLTAIHRTLAEGLGKALTPLLPQLQQLADGGLAFFKWLGDNPIVTTIMLSIALAIGAIAAAQWVWNAAQLANPTTWIILGIVAAIAILVVGIWALATNWDGVWKNITNVWNGFMGWIGDGLGWLGARIADVWNGAGKGIGDVFHAIQEGGKTALNWIIGRLNDLINLLNTVMDGLKRVTGIDLGHISGIPGLATGGTVTGSGTVLVGEAGPELLQLPRGASVIPLDHPAANAARGGNNGPNIHLTTVNPVAEPTSRTVQRAGQMIGALLGV